MELYGRNLYKKFLCILASAATLGAALTAQAVPIVTLAPLGGFNFVDDMDIVLTPDGTKALTLVAQFLTIVDTATGQVEKVALSAVDFVPGRDIVLTPDGTKALIQGANLLSIVDLATKDVTVAFLPVSNNVQDIDIVPTPDNSKALILGGGLQVVDLATAVVTTVNVPVNLIPGVDVQVTPDSKKALLMSGSDIAIVDLTDNTFVLAETDGASLIADEDIVLTSDGAKALKRANADLLIIDVATADVTKVIIGASNLVPGVDVQITSDDSTAVFLAAGDLVKVDIATGAVTKIPISPGVSGFVEDVDVALTPDGTKAVFTTGGAGNSVFIADLIADTITAVPLIGTVFVPGIDPQITPDGTKALLPFPTGVAIIDIATATVTNANTSALNLVPGLDVLIAPDGGTAVVSSGPALSLVQNIPANSALYLGGTKLFVIDIATGSVDEVSLGAVALTPNVDLQITTRPDAFGPDDDIPISPVVLGTNKRGEVDQLTVITLKVGAALIAGGTQIEEKALVDTIATTRGGGTVQSGVADQTLIQSSLVGNPFIAQSVVGAASTSVGNGEFASATAGLFVKIDSDGNVSQQAFAQAEAWVVPVGRRNRLAEAHAIATKEVIYTDWIVGELFTLDYVLVQLALGLDPVGTLTTESIYTVTQTTDILGLEELWSLTISSALDAHGNFVANVAFHSNSLLTLSLTDLMVIDLLRSSFIFDPALGKLVFTHEAFRLTSAFIVDFQQWTLTTTVASWARSQYRVPEPASLSLFLAGLLLLVLVRYGKGNRAREEKSRMAGTGGG